jgi:hypothetical protein
MRASEFTTEAETGTHRAEHIFDTLADKGYVRLGSGADATVWARDAHTVIKIIMPDGVGAARDGASRTFYRFYDFCQSHRDLDCLPRFHKIGGVHHSTFTVDDVDYIQIAMERLQPLEQDSQRTALVWMFSDLSAKNVSWDDAWERIQDPHAWSHWDDSTAVTVEDIMVYIDEQDHGDRAEWAVLYNVMRLLYHRGRINKMGWDLHTENVMLRGDTLVIVDPWFNALTDDL